MTQSWLSDDTQVAMVGWWGGEEYIINSWSCNCNLGIQAGVWYY